SRRRHTRWPRDWSSDVCSSDLLVTHLTERLVDGPEGQKVFRDSAVTNVLEFFDRFRQLNVRSNAQLDDLVEQAQRVVRGVDAKSLRDSDALRREVAGQLGRVQTALDGMLVNQPRRRIIRSHPSSNGANDAASD